MPVINPLMVPTIAPGSIFSALTADEELNVRWLTALDPVFYGTFNRPLADIVLRQLILAKAIDNLNSSLGHEALFPFIIQPRIVSGTGDVDVPITWLWDIQLALPKKWENVRLAKIKRISGTNTGYTGKLRLIFTATQQNSNIETGILLVDYTIDSTLTYQIVRVSVVTTDEEAVAIDASEQATVTGFVIFKTLDVNDTTVQAFLNTVAPPTNQADANSDGLFDNPAIYELIDAIPSDPSGHFSQTSVSHGTGMFESSAWTPIPSLDSDVQSWVESFNYPFDSNANRISTANITIPLGLFREFNLTAPAGDEPTGDTSGLFYPVWITRIERVDSTSDHLRFYFATHNVTDTATGGTPSTEAVEFATLDLTNNMTPGEIVEIIPSNNLQLQEGSDAALFGQHIGRGHVVLSSVWGNTSTTIEEFFATFAGITDSPADTLYSQSSTRLSSFGLSRVPKYTPTIGQAQAMFGSSARLDTPVHPSFQNRFVTEADQGAGNEVDLESETGITPSIAIERFGNSGTLCHRTVKLIVNATLESGANFYTQEVLPRLRILLGRDPIFGDEWFNGTRFMKYNGDTWEG